MKNKFLIISMFICTISVCFVACSDDNDKPNVLTISFLEDIRPIYFENLNFESEEIVSQIPDFLNNLTETFVKLEIEYEMGLFTSQNDLENMRLASMYYSFYMLGLTGTYLDGNIEFNDINGNKEIGFFSNLPSNDPNFEQLEMEAMMDRAIEVISRGVNINGYNDKTNGFYVAIKQVNARLRNNNLSTSEAHGEAVSYVSTRLVDYGLISNWNVLMSMVTMTNYEDPLNTFDNPGMDELLFHVNARLVPGSLPDLGGRYPEILGPLYRFDINLKKIDWYLNTYPNLEVEQLEQIDEYINVLETASSFIEEERTDLLNSWIHKNTFDQRVEKLNQIKEFREDTTIETPLLTPYINSSDFKKAYQCYSCHRSSGL